MTPNEHSPQDLPDQLPLTLDCFSPNSILQICPKLPLLSSQAVGWDGLVLNHHRQPAHETPEHRIAQHVLILSPAGSLIQVDYWLDDQSFRGLYGDGNITIIPANVCQQGRWAQEIEFIGLSFDPTWLVSVAYEAVEPERFELLPHIAIHDPLIHQLGWSLRRQLENTDGSYRLYVDSLVTALAMHLIQHYATRQPKIRTYAEGLPKSSLRRVIDYINSHLDQDLKLADIANVAGLSQYYFARLFKQSLGITPHQYAMQQRIERARQLLRESDLPIAEISMQCGFTNQSHLSKYFRQFTGITPKAYRNQYR